VIFRTTHTDLINILQKWSVDWDSATQGQVLSSYFYGFPVFCVFGGWAAGKYSGKIVLLVMMTTLSVASMGIPYAAITSPYLVMVLRFIVGLASVRKMSSDKIKDNYTIVLISEKFEDTSKGINSCTSKDR
jgi:MFS family permease